MGGVLCLTIATAAILIFCVTTEVLWGNPNETPRVEPLPDISVDSQIANKLSLAKAEIYSYLDTYTTRIQKQLEQMRTSLEDLSSQTMAHRHASLQEMTDLHNHQKQLILSVSNLTNHISIIEKNTDDRVSAAVSLAIASVSESHPPSVSHDFSQEISDISKEVQKATLKEAESLMDERTDELSKKMNAEFTAIHDQVITQSAHMESVHTVINLMKETITRHIDSTQQTTEHQNRKINEVATAITKLEEQAREQEQAREEFNIKILKDPTHEDQDTSNTQAIDILRSKVVELQDEILRDGTGRIDWCLQSLGAKIVHSQTSSPLNSDDWWETVISKVVSLPSSEDLYNLAKPIGKPPEIVLQPDVFPGQCFAFKGTKGNITVQLPARILVSSISIDHALPDVSNNPNSAPKDFAVYAWIEGESSLNNGNSHSSSDYFEDKSDDNSSNLGIFSRLWNKSRDAKIKHQLGTFTFNYPSTKRWQSIIIDKPTVTTRVTFNFLSNYGAPYTCIYRVRVHGRKLRRTTS